MAEENPSASIRSSQGSHRRTPKNVSSRPQSTRVLAMPVASADTPRDAAAAAALANRKERHPPAGRDEAAPRSVGRAH
jgi:hypothetical protein